MPSELYNIRVSDDLHPISIRVVRDVDLGITTITYEYLLKGIDSRDQDTKIQPMTQLFTRVIEVDDSVSPHPSEVMSAVQTIGAYMEVIAVAKESKNPYPL